MEVSDKHYNAIEKTYADTASAVRWAYIHWALDTGIESALKEAMGDEVSKNLISLLGAVEALLADGRGIPGPALALRVKDFDPNQE